MTSYISRYYQDRGFSLFSALSRESKIPRRLFAQVQARLQTLTHYRQWRQNCRLSKVVYIPRETPMEAKTTFSNIIQRLFIDKYLS